MKNILWMQLARAQGDFLLVGLHTDDDVMERRGAHLPIMDLHERALSVLACCYVNEVIIGARHSQHLWHAMFPSWVVAFSMTKDSVPTLVAAIGCSCPKLKLLPTLVTMLNLFHSR